MVGASRSPRFRRVHRRFRDDRSVIPSSHQSLPRIAQRLNSPFPSESNSSSPPPSPNVTTICRGSGLGPPRGHDQAVDRIADRQQNQRFPAVAPVAHHRSHEKRQRCQQRESGSEGIAGHPATASACPAPSAGVRTRSRTTGCSCATKKKAHSASTVSKVPETMNPTATPMLAQCPTRRRAAGVHRLEARGEQPVAAHGEQDPAVPSAGGVHAAQDREQHQQPDDQVAPRAEQGLARGRGDERIARHPADAEHADERDVDAARRSG